MPLTGRSLGSMKIIYLSLLSVIIAAQAGCFYYDYQAKQHDAESAAQFREQTRMVLDQVQTKTNNALDSVLALKQLYPTLLSKATQAAEVQTQQVEARLQSQIAQLQKASNQAPTQSNNAVSDPDDLQDLKNEMQEIETQVLLLKKQQIDNANTPHLPQSSLSAVKGQSFTDDDCFVQYRKTHPWYCTAEQKKETKPILQRNLLGKKD
jgi:hypothetical protein